MKHEFVRVAAATPDIRVADCVFNAEQISRIIDSAEEQMVKVLLFPELCLTGYTCGDLFLQDVLLNNAKEQLIHLVNYTVGKDVLVAVGLPIVHLSKLYNAAALMQNGRLLGIVPKRFIPNYSEFYEARHFAQGKENVTWIEFNKDRIPFGSRILFQSKELEHLRVGVEICEDLWTMRPPSGDHAAAGATVILNLSASDELTGKGEYRKELVRNQSARLISAYLYADAGEGESTTDLVFAGHNMIAENGVLLAESERFQNSMIVTELDLGRLANDRRKMTTFLTEVPDDYTMVSYSYSKLTLELPVLKLNRHINKSPFVPEESSDRKRRCEEIIQIQAMGLKKRLHHTGCTHAVVGVSGGLDSTLALLITKRAFELLDFDTKGILAVTMPCFGTTDRTYQNAVRLIGELGAEFREVGISESVTLHLRDIGHPLDQHDVTFENAQARERTQVIMDLANQCNGMVIGTGDMSELALGWATYNGDHMSMYGVNASVPKTLVRYLVSYFAEEAKSKGLKDTLYDILDTPVSPELLPPKHGTISQKTEDIVGPYELHDFFLYYIMRYGFTPGKIYRMAGKAFHGIYENAVILKWLGVFYRRFFSQQFKRSCLPDGPKVGSIAVSPRGDLRMPSDACATAWLQEIKTLENTFS